MPVGTQLDVFERGQTLYGRSQTIPTTYEGKSLALEGYEHVFKHIDPSDITKLASHRDVHAIIMRNVSGVTLYKSMAIRCQAGNEWKRFDGHTAVTAELCYGIIDDYLWSAGVRSGDLCWVIVRGPVLHYTGADSGGFSGNAWAAGQLLVAATAAGSTSNTVSGTTGDVDAGHLINLNSALTCTSTQSTDGTNNLNIVNRAGRVLSAATSGETNTLKLIDIGVKL